MRRFKVWMVLSLVMLFASALGNAQDIQDIRPAGVDEMFTKFRFTVRLEVPVPGTNCPVGTDIPIELGPGSSADTKVKRSSYNEAQKKIDTEILRSQISGSAGCLGTVTVRVGSQASPSVSTASLGEITNIKTSPEACGTTGSTCRLVEGDSEFRVFFEIDIQQSGLTVVNKEPKILRAHITRLPPSGFVYEPPQPPIPLFLKGTNTRVGVMKGRHGVCQSQRQCPDFSSSIPTLTEWGLIVLGLLLAGSLAFMIRRRFIARPAGA